MNLKTRLQHQAYKINLSQVSPQEKSEIIQTLAQIHNPQTLSKETQKKLSKKLMMILQLD